MYEVGGWTVGVNNYFNGFGKLMLSFSAICLYALVCVCERMCMFSLCVQTDIFMFLSYYYYHTLIILRRHYVTLPEGPNVLIYLFSFSRLNFMPHTYTTAYQFSAVRICGLPFHK